MKYLLLDKWHEENPEKIIGNEKDKRRDVLKSHNLEKILKEDVYKRQLLSGTVR